MARALINLPSKVKRGELVEVKTLVQHAMETGFRTGNDGRLVPRDIIHRFVCTYGGKEVFRAELFPAIAANPFLSFSFRAEETGVVTFAWQDDRGETQVQTATLNVD